MSWGWSVLLLVEDSLYGGEVLLISAFDRRFEGTAMVVCNNGPIVGHGITKSSIDLNFTLQLIIQLDTLDGRTIHACGKCLPQ